MLQSSQGDITQGWCHTPVSLWISNRVQQYLSPACPLITYEHPFFFIDSKGSARMATVSVVAFSFLLTTGTLRKVSGAVPCSRDLQIWKLCLNMLSNPVTKTLTDREEKHSDTISQFNWWKEIIKITILLVSLLIYIFFPLCLQLFLPLWKVRLSLPVHHI